MTSVNDPPNHTIKRQTKDTDLQSRKTKFIDKLEKLVKKLPISEKNLGAWIRAFHFNLPIYMLLLIFFGPKYMALVGLTGVIICLFIFIYLQCCWLSLLEKRICSDDVNIVDAWIEAITFKRIDYNSTNKKDLCKIRFKATMIIGSIYIFISFFVYYNRFHV